MALRAARAAGGVTATWAPWGAAATCRVASAAACPGSAARTATSVPRATGASARVAAQVSVGSSRGHWDRAVLLLQLLKAENSWQLSEGLCIPGCGVWMSTAGIKPLFPLSPEG